MRKNNKLELVKIRSNIDTIDTKILKLLNQRASFAKKTTKFKLNNVYDPKREREVLNNLSKNKAEHLTPQSIKQIYGEILSACREVQAPIEVSYLGPEGSNTGEVAKRQFGNSATFFSQQTISDVLTSIEKEEADFGIVPLENSLEGPVVETLDGLVEKNVNIISQIDLKISHFLMSQEKSTMNINKIYSHPQALAQCKKYIQKIFLEAELIEVQSTARAAQIVSGKKKSAAIAPRACSSLYSLNILDKNIQDNSSNTTVFALVEKASGDPKVLKNSKVSVAFSLDHKPGSLHQCLKPFRDSKINLTKIQSRPSKKNDWDYLFFIDFVVDRNIKEAQTCLKILKEKTPFLKILGVFT
tara:strand:- start:1047 stop:2117 length:1071 start_codon:yes stop_codon:yes gene_type:complete